MMNMQTIEWLTVSMVLEQKNEQITNTGMNE